MNIITHFLFSWSVAEITKIKKREKELLTIGGTLPDLDGFGIVPDLISRMFKLPDPAFFGTYHHNLFHGIFGAILISSFLTFFSKTKIKTFFLLFLIIHLHFLLDFLGSRGPTPCEIWEINYFAPFSDSLQISWKYQWKLNSPINIIFTIFLLVFSFYRAHKYGNSPLIIFSKKANEVFVKTLRKRFNEYRK